MVSFFELTEVFRQLSHYKLDENKKPVLCTFLEYREWQQKQENKTGIGVTVAREERNGVMVSTVFLGSDHGWGNGPPVLWETMIFGGDHDEYCQRYASYEDAVAGHKAAVEKFLQ